VADPAPPTPPLQVQVRTAADPEYQGALLLEELRELQAANVPVNYLLGCARMMNDLRSLSAPEVMRRLEAVARERLTAFPALVVVLARHANGVKSDTDLPAFTSHFERLAQLAALVPAMSHASQRLPAEEEP
jgi:hypothetical protein